MADLESKTGQSLGIPTTTPKTEKRPTFSAAGKPTHVEHPGRVEAFKTFLWVAPLTALIWIYAEREQIATAEVTVQIKLLSKSSDRIITVTSPLERPTKISLDIQGPRASLNELRDVLTKVPVEVYVSPDVGYKGDFSLAEPITKSDLFKTYAVAVTAAPSVTIKVEAKSSRRIPVKVSPQDKFVGTVTFEPDSVVIEGPKDTLEGIKPENLVAYADLRDFASKPPGSYPPQDVTISLGSPTVDVTMKESVRAKVEISKSAPYPIPPIPIVLQINGRVLSDDKFKITTALDTLGDVQVIGPLDKIELLKQRMFPAAVVVDMTDDKKFDFATITTTADKPYTLSAKDYRMPPGVTVNNPARDITITITRRGN